MECSLLKRGILLVLALALLPGLQARAQQSKATAEALCKSSKCSIELTPWLDQLEECKGSTSTIGTLQKQVKALEGERDGKEKELSSCAVATIDAERLAKEATDQAETLKKEIEALKKAVEEERKLAAGKGDSERLAEAVRLANAWKHEADRIKEEGDAARKEAAALKAETEAAKKEVIALKAEVASAKKGLETRIASADPNDPDAKDRGLKTYAPKATAAADKAVKETAAGKDAPSGEIEDKNKQLQAVLEHTRRVLAETEKEKVASDGVIRQVLGDLVDSLGRTFECSSFSIETRGGGTRVLKGAVAESRHRDEAWRKVLDSPLAKLVNSSEIDVTASGGQVCFVKTRASGWLMARERGSKGGQASATFLRRFLDPSVIPLLPPASGDSDCETLGAVIKSLEPLDNRPIGADAVFVRARDDRVAQCYDSGSGWRLRPIGASDAKAAAWLLVPGSRPDGGTGRP
jgi:hypothetical protein